MDTSTADAPPAMATRLVRGPTFLPSPRAGARLLALFLR